MKVYKIEIIVIDFDELGEIGVKSVIENTKYQNRCIYPKVKKIETRTVQWTDEHPLNYSQSDAEYKRLFDL